MLQCVVGGPVDFLTGNFCLWAGVGLFTGQSGGVWPQARWVRREGFLAVSRGCEPPLRIGHAGEVPHLIYFLIRESCLLYIEVALHRIVVDIPYASAAYKGIRRV